MTAPRTPPAAVEAAIDWMVRLESGDATPQDHQACQRWQRERPENAQAWAAIAGFSRQLKSLPSALAHGTLAAAHRPRRRAVLRSMVLLGGAGALGAPPDRWQALAADHRTGVGEHRRLALADGSLLHLNTATAVDVGIGAQQRCVSLLGGEVLVDCAPGRGATPWLVRTAEGRLQARDGRFLVRQFTGRTHVQALTAEVDVRPRAPAAASVERRLRPGQQWLFDAQGGGPFGSTDADAAAWTDGVLVARDMPLRDLAAELARYRRGWLRCEPAVAALRISGVFPLNDFDRVLAALQRTLPVRARSITPWWVSLSPR